LNKAVNTALRRLSVLSDIEDELQSLSGVPAKVNRILSTLQQLNNGASASPAPATQGRRSVRMMESSADKQNSWASGLF